MSLSPTLAKFDHPDVTPDGQPRAFVDLVALRTLWFNTGTLCNIECGHCYIESSPLNDRLAYLTLAEVRQYLDEVVALELPTVEIGFTGGEPFMNGDFIGMLDETMRRGFRALVLTNAMQPMQRPRVLESLRQLRRKYDRQLTLRVSIDHYTGELHEIERGSGTWKVALSGLEWLAREGFRVAVAGRTCWQEAESELRAGYARLFAERNIPVNAHDAAELVLFPEMDEAADVPEITTSCWEVLGQSPDDVMCASSRMVVRRMGGARPTVLACTLIPYDPQFELGESLEAATGSTVKLNHPHCAKFCVLGGGSCSVDL